MKISKKDALDWFRFFSALPEGEELFTRQTEIVYDTVIQIERAVEARRKTMLSEVKGLSTIGGRSSFVGDEKKISPGCRQCLTGRGLNAIRKTNRCNLKCPFCYNYGEMGSQEPIGDGYWEIGGCRYREDDIKALIDIQGAPAAVSYVYLEPFMEIEKYYQVMKVFHDAGVHQHMYTNGTLADKDNLRALGEAGLDELRFNLGATDCSDRVIENIAEAKKYIPRVGIETPMTPGYHEKLMEKKERILSTGVDLMNMAELHLNPNNVSNYEGEVMYMSRFGYISPVWSRDLTIMTMKTASEEGWPCAVHDCSNMTKYMRGINLKAREGGFFGESDYAMEFDSIPYELFIPALEDDTLPFPEEEPLPEGYRIGELLY